MRQARRRRSDKGQGVAWGHRRADRDPGEKLGLHDKVYACDTFSRIVRAGDEVLTMSGRACRHEPAIRIIFYQALKFDNFRSSPESSPEILAAGRSLKFRFCHIGVDLSPSATVFTDQFWEVAPRL